MNVRALGPGDDGAVAAAQHLFDGPSDPAATARFLADPDHHLLVAYNADDWPVGFVSGVEMTHPGQRHRDVPLRARGPGTCPPSGHGPQAPASVALGGR